MQVTLCATLRWVFQRVKSCKMILPKIYNRRRVTQWNEIFLSFLFIQSSYQQSCGFSAKPDMRQKGSWKRNCPTFQPQKIKSALKPTFIKTSKNDISIDIKNAANKTNTKFECFFDILIFLNPVNNFRRISHRLSKETLPTRQISRNAKCCHINAQVM